jgi:hypothetical protein
MMQMHTFQPQPILTTYDPNPSPSVNHPSPPQPQRTNPNVNRSLDRFHFSLTSAAPGMVSLGMEWYRPHPAPGLTTFYVYIVTIEP